MSTKVTTTPRPVGRSMGIEVYETGNIVPSLRMNQSSSACSGSPVVAGRITRHSAAGNGVPSGCL